MQPIDRIVVSDGTVVFEGMKVPEGVFLARIERFAGLGREQVLARVRLVELEGARWRSTSSEVM